MYTFTNKLRNFSITLMVVGFLGLTYGFLTAPETVEEATLMVVIRIMVRFVVENIRRQCKLLPF